MASSLKSFFSSFTTKTVWSAIAGAAAYVSQNDPTKLMTWVNAVIGIITAASVRSAIDSSSASPTK